MKKNVKIIKTKKKKRIKKIKGKLVKQVIVTQIIFLMKEITMKTARKK